MNILGISGGLRQGYQDVSACIVTDGRLVAAVEEERLSRIKFSNGKLPYLSVWEVLKIAKLEFSDIDYIAFQGKTWGVEVQKKLEQYFIYHFGFCPPFIRLNHHDCHAASTFFASGFDTATVITYDNSGDGISLQIMKGDSNGLQLVEQFKRPLSLGLFYQLITQYCGFVKDKDEYKVMGLSSYGNRSSIDFSFLIDFQNGHLSIQEEFFNLPLPGQPGLHQDEMVFSESFIARMGKGRRLPKGAMEEFYINVAASAQDHFEKLVLKIAEYYISKVEYRNLCIAGGSALNCVANQKLMNAPFVDGFFVQPAACDAGISLGAAWLLSFQKGFKPILPLHSYGGPSFSDSEIEQVLMTSMVKWEYKEDFCLDAAKEILANKVIGWFQGAMEFGPRALGNRSILGNPAEPKMKEIINAKVKFREGFRPFCPSVLEEDIALYFEGKLLQSPYMTVTYQVRPEVRSKIPAVTHVDGTARIQTVNSQQNSVFYKLLNELKRISGHGVVLNTSFNLSHEPIVCSPRDALATFFASGIDVLYLGKFKVLK